jgi:hypothetical protein
MKRILILFLLLLSFSTYAQRVATPPAGTSLFGQNYISPTRHFFVGTPQKGFYQVPFKLEMDSLLNLKLPALEFSNFQTSNAAALALKLDASTYNTGIVGKADKNSFDAYVTANNIALGQKVDQDGSKVLSDNNYSSVEKTNVATIPAIAAAANAATPISIYTTNKAVTENRFSNLFAKSGSVLINAIPVGKFIAPQQNSSSGTSLSETSRYWFSPKFDCTDLQFLFANWSLHSLTSGQAREDFGLNDITIKATIYVDNNAYLGRTFYPLTFNGVTSITIKPGQTVKCDPIPFNIVSGTNYALSTNVSVTTTGQKWPLGLMTQTTLNEGVASGDQTAGAVSFNNTLGYGPFAIMAKPMTTPVYQKVVLFGDSHLDGNAGGGAGIDANQGWARRGLDAINCPWIKFTCGGDQMLNHVGNLGLALVNSTGGGIALDNFGTNDILNWATLAEAQAAYLKWWGWQKSLGFTIYQATILPRTDGGFNASKEAMRVALNAWFKTLPAPLSKVVDVDILAETSLNSGVWKAGYSSDGVHFNSASEALGGVAIIASDFLAIPN